MLQGSAELLEQERDPCTTPTVPAFSHMGSGTTNRKSHPSDGLIGQNTRGNVGHPNIHGVPPRTLIIPDWRPAAFRRAYTNYRSATESGFAAASHTSPANKRPSVGTCAHTGSPRRSVTAREQLQARPAHLQSRRTQFLCSPCRCRADSPIAPWPASAPEHGWVLS